ncbi:hypothetical protein CSPX01_04694 [Colletotrichum filicis]|nr:hypothetical protein CSPX01_04694 [Colletotrichum filicis]
MRNPIQWPPSSPRAQRPHVIPSSNPIPSTRVGLRGERREKKEEVAKSREGKDHAAMQQRYAATPSPAPSSGKAQLSGAATHHFLQLFDFRSRPTEYAPLLYLYKASISKLKKNHYPHESTSTADETTETATYKHENIHTLPAIRVWG